eukprot:1460448-Pleurochrysis_carterae.AAC.2
MEQQVAQFGLDPASLDLAYYKSLLSALLQPDTIPRPRALFASLIAGDADAYERRHAQLRGRQRGNRKSWRMTLNSNPRPRALFASLITGYADAYERRHAQLRGRQRGGCGQVPACWNVCA